MDINKLASSIHHLDETGKTRLFEKILLSELDKRMSEEQIIDKAKFTRQFKQELEQELATEYKNLNFAI